MKKRILQVSIAAFTILNIMVYSSCNSTKVVNKNTVSASAEIKNTIPSDWKTYTNTELGLSFQYPNTWNKNEKETEVPDGSGAITAVEMNFMDTISNTTFNIGYHYSHNGVELYNYAASQGDTSYIYKEIEVAGSKAIQSTFLIRTSSHGNLLNPPIKLIVVDFLDKKQENEIQLQFKTFSNNNENNEVKKFNQLISCFKFINK